MKKRKSFVCSTNKFSFKGQFFFASFNFFSFFTTFEFLSWICKSSFLSIFCTHYKMLKNCFALRRKVWHSFFEVDRTNSSQQEISSSSCSFKVGSFLSTSFIKMQETNCFVSLSLSLLFFARKRIHAKNCFLPKNVGPFKRERALCGPALPF